jgi:hypothetical protein
MGGEDFACYLQHVPGTFTFFGTNGNEDWHHPAFTVDEAALIKSSYFLYESAKRLLNENIGRDKNEEKFIISSDSNSFIGVRSLRKEW